MNWMYVNCRSKFDMEGVGKVATCIRLKRNSRYLGGGIHLEVFHTQPVSWLDIRIDMSVRTSKGRQVTQSKLKRDRPRYDITKMSVRLSFKAKVGSTRGGNEG
jgi:hypothetical protein